MNVILAESYGMCFGVRDAIALALGAPRRAELTVLGELVHNADVLRRLEEEGIRTASGIEAQPATPRVMVTAHGASGRAVAGLRARGLEVLDATCPLVRHAHRSLQRLVGWRYFPATLGKRPH